MLCILGVYATAMYNVYCTYFRNVPEAYYENNSLIENLLKRIDALGLCNERLPHATFCSCHSLFRSKLSGDHDAASH